jgi:DNA-directed RNA polymerase subunit RPC12/RpoP
MFQVVPQVKPITLIMSVKMACKKKLMMLGLVLVTILMVSSMFVYAKKPVQNLTNVKAKPVVTNTKGLVTAVSVSPGNTRPQRITPSISQVQVEDELEQESYEDVDIEPYIQEYEKLPEDQHTRARCIWIVFAKGNSWETEPSTDAVEARAPMAMRFAARPVMDTGDGILFKVPRGIVGHDGERYQLEGYGWARKEDGLFYMKLDGEDIHMKVVGKVFLRNSDVASSVRCPRCHRVVMKGKMTVEGEDYNFALKGHAFRLCLCICEPVTKPEETVSPTFAS